jgi:hypothetical protein
VYIALLPILVPFLGLFVVGYFGDIGWLVLYVLVGWWVLGLITLLICKLVMDVVRAGSLSAWMSMTDK